MASAAIPMVTGGLGALATGYYYTMIADHSPQTMREKSAWLLKYAFLLVGGFAAGRWIGVMINAITLGTYWQTAMEFPLIFVALLGLKAAVAWRLFTAWRS